MFLSLKIQKNKLFKLDVQAATEKVVQVNAENRVAVEGTVTSSKDVVVNEEQIHIEILSEKIQYTLKARAISK